MTIIFEGNSGFFIENDSVALVIPEAAGEYFSALVTPLKDGAYLGEAVSGGSASNNDDTQKAITGGAYIRIGGQLPVLGNTLGVYRIYCRKMISTGGGASTIIFNVTTFKRKLL